jgi:hypothetical protein
MGTAVKTATTSPASWDAFSDVDAFVDEVLVELAAMEDDGTKPTRSGKRQRMKVFNLFIEDESSSNRGQRLRFHGLNHGYVIGL